MTPDTQSNQRPSTASQSITDKLADRVYNAIAPRPFCRDCADNDGRCPATGELCEPKEKAKEIADAVRSSEHSSAANRLADAAEALSKEADMIYGAIMEQVSMMGRARFNTRQELLQQALAAYREEQKAEQGITDTQRLDWWEKFGPIEHEDAYSGEKYMCYVLEVEHPTLSLRSVIDIAIASTDARGGAR